MQSTNATGNNVSMAPISFENRFNIRPDVLLIKNAIVARVILRNNLSCKLMEARKHILKNANER
jgi:hypothetical protein